MLKLSTIELKQIDKQIRDIALKHMKKPAWGVVFLALSAIAIFTLSTICAVLNIIPIWLGFIINLICCYTLFTPVHEAVHHTISGDDHKLDWLNKTVGWVSGIISLVAYKGFRTLHLRHHQNTNIAEKDPDYWAHGSNAAIVFMKTLIQMPAYFWHVFVKWKPTRKDIQIEIAIALIHHIGALIILGIAFYFGYGLQVLLLWYAPAIIAIALDALFFDWMVHKPHKNPQRFYNTSVFVFTKFWNRAFPILLLGQNYHLVHHLYPRIPFYRYGKAFYEMRPYLEKAGSNIYEI